MTHDSYHQDQKCLGSIEVTPKKSNTSFVERPLELHPISELEGYSDSVVLAFGILGKSSIDFSENSPTCFNVLRCCFVELWFANYVTLVNQ